MRTGPDLATAVHASPTPTLWLGAVPDWPDVVPVASAEEAVQSIDSGKRVFVDRHRWDLIGQVLARFGMTTEQIQEQLSFVRPCTLGPALRLEEDPV